MSALLVSLALLQTASPSGAEIVRRSQRAYQAVPTIEQDARASMNQWKGTAHISFARPGRLRVTGSSMTNTKYDLVVDGKAVWVFANGAWAPHESAEMGIAAITGVSVNAGTTVPGILVNTQFANPLPNLAKAKLTVARERVGGRDAYRVEGKAVLPMKIWFDAKSYFILRTETDAMGNTIVVDFTPPKVGQPIPASRFKR